MDVCLSLISYVHVVAHVMNSGLSSVILLIVQISMMGYIKF
jgi:hypothetical protein